jgi:gentisate 1,2-dioxygenase
VPHRHSAAAIRFATRAEGAVTIVNGRRCEMQEADQVLTPPMCWHGHINQGKRRTVWYDAANMPAICALDACRRDKRSGLSQLRGVDMSAIRSPFAPAKRASMADSPNHFAGRAMMRADRGGNGSRKRAPACHLFPEGGSDGSPPGGISSASGSAGT